MGALGIMNFEFLSLCGAFMVFFYLRTPGTERKCPKEVGQEVEFTICTPTGCETPEVAENWAKLRVQQKKLSAEIVESQLYAWFYPQFYVLCIRVLGTGVQLIHYNTPFGWRNNFEMCQLAAIMIADNKLTDMWLQEKSYDITYPQFYEVCYAMLFYSDATHQSQYLCLDGIDNMWKTYHRGGEENVLRKTCWLNNGLRSFSASRA